MVDWEKGASQSYSIASARVPFVARNLEYFLKWMTFYAGSIRASSVHLVGFGLGAHVAGIASRYLSSVTEVRYPLVIGRITGK